MTDLSSDNSRFPIFQQVTGSLQNSKLMNLLIRTCLKLLLETEPQIFAESEIQVCRYEDFNSFQQFRVLCLNSCYG